MNNTDFSAQQQEAIKRMKEINSRSIYNQNSQNKSHNRKVENQNSLLKGFNIPFLENLRNDSDQTLILGILLLLLSEKADKRLLFALIYILL